MGTLDTEIDISAVLRGVWGHKEAKEQCKALGMSLYTDTTSEHRQQLRKSMRDSVVYSTWLNLRRIKHRNWTWTDGRGTVLDSNILRQRPTSGCAYIRSQSYVANIYGSLCEQRLDSYICQTEGCAICKKGECVKLENNVTFCLVFNYAKVTWYEAFRFCEIDNAALATMASQYLAGSKRPKGDMWIGLARDYWTWDESIAGIPKVTNWKPHQYPSLEDDCAIIRKTKEGVWWESRHCNEPAHVICFIQVLGNKSMTPMSTQMTSVKIDIEKPHTLYFVWVLGGAAFACAIVSGSVFLLMLCRGKQEQNQESGRPSTVRWSRWLSRSRESSLYGRDKEEIDFYAFTRLSRSTLRHAGSGTLKFLKRSLPRPPPTLPPPRYQRR